MPGESKKSVVAALIGNTLVAITKYIAAAITGSSAMLSEAVHSTSDTGNQVLMLLGLHKAKRPADRAHPFGHGKEIYFWCLIVAMLLFGLGGGVSIYEGILELVGEPRDLGDPLVNYVVLAIAACFETYSLTVAGREFWKHKGDRGVVEAIHRGKDPSYVVVLLEDTAALLGLVVAAGGVLATELTGDATWDAIASIVIGTLLCAVATWLAYESKGLLVGESAEPEMERRLEALAAEEGVVDHATRVMTMYFGPDAVLVAMDLAFTKGARSDDIAGAVSRLDRRIRDEFPRVKNVFLEVSALA